MTQLNLFTNKRCTHCRSGQTKPGNPSLWDGFRDQDTGELVCRGCRKFHYVKKANALGTLEVKGKKYLIKSMTYSEMPVLL